MAAELNQAAISTGKRKRLRPQPYTAPAGGWGSVKSLALLPQNKPDSFACVSCAWAKPADRPIATGWVSSGLGPAASSTSARLDFLS